MLTRIDLFRIEAMLLHEKPKAVYPKAVGRFLTGRRGDSLLMRV